MKIGQLFADENAVSPVIGVILMVAITVILAAVIASFVLGGLGPSETAPQASFGFEYEDSNGTAGVLTISHDSGAAVEPSEVVIDVSGTEEDNGLSETTDLCDGTSCDEEARLEWPSSAYSGSEISSGDDVTIEVDNDYEVSVVWESSSGDQSATLGESTGPAA